MENNNDSGSGYTIFSLDGEIIETSDKAKQTDPSKLMTSREAAIEKAIDYIDGADGGNEWD